MCGIVGYTGSDRASQIILSGLEKLEYRGYDSSGISLCVNNMIETVKFTGRLRNLTEHLEVRPVRANVGIGHTRWATHGEPSERNSHPHMNADGTISVVHNGIIENYQELKEDLINKGYFFVSETDTEVVVHLIDYCYRGDILKAVFEAVNKLKGAFALGIISSNEPEKLIGVRKESPLILGIGKGENYIASDIPAILEYTRDVIFLENGEIAELTKDGVNLFDFEGNTVNRECFHVDWDIEAASKGGYEHFMLKEIFEQPIAIKDTIQRRLDDEGYIKLDDIKLDKKALENITKIYIVACGTAYHAGKVGKFAIEKLAKIPVETDIASEFRYSDPFVDENTLLILVSQSGETADTLAALREAKRKGARIMSITNVVGSSIARESNDVLYTWAGPEVAVASTKAYTTQLVAFYMIALDMALKKETISVEEYHNYINEIMKLPEKVSEIIENLDAEKYVAESICDINALFYLGRGVDYQTALEGALKLKEISYIYTEAFAAGELKHGTIALIEEGTPVIAVATQENLIEKMVSNIREVKARGAKVYSITTKTHKDIQEVSDYTIFIPETIDILQPILSVVPCQAIAYYTSVYKGNDVDKPRNLAKSVTVE
ncbi:MAG: glutamine--fructose-6-phosphate transaminase (isomerizing) [Filifactoraceae bacterium]